MITIFETIDDTVTKTRIDGLLPLLLQHVKQLKTNHDLTIPEAARFGLGWCEVLAVLEDRSFDPDEIEANAKTKVIGLIAAYKAEQERQRLADIEADNQSRMAEEAERTRVLGLRPRYLNITAHCKDLCSFSLLSENKETIIEQDEGYVPYDLGVGGGDDVELLIDLDTGVIVNWKSPSLKARTKVVRQLTNEDDDDDD